MKEKDIAIVFQSKTGAIELRGDFEQDTIWANLQQIADLFYTDKSGVSRHIRNIFQSQELDADSTVAKFATVQKEGKRSIKRNVTYYNLDVILSVGYRVNSKTATTFRQWATNTLRDHIVSGYTINKKRIAQNYDAFMKAVGEVKRLLPEGKSQILPKDILNLVESFASTWLALDAYDKKSLPSSGFTKRRVEIASIDLEKALSLLKSDLITKGTATDLFAAARSEGSLDGIIGAIFQSFDGKDLYPSIEEKSAHLLYFIVKNHPFIDGNKRSGAFAFVWFLQKMNVLDSSRINPEALTVLTLLVAESNPRDKEKIIGLILMILK